MNEILQIQTKFQEFADFLETVDINQLRQHYSRSELKEFQKQLNAIKMRSLAYQIGQVVEEMKKEEFPELLGIHHYPALKEIDFLTEEQKKALDERLTSFRKGHYVQGLWHILKDSKKEKQIKEFLIQKGIVEQKYVVICPNCSDEWLSSVMNQEQKEQLDRLLLLPPHADERYEGLEEILQDGCMECSYMPRIETIQEVTYKTLLEMTINRDTSLDQV